MADTLLIALQRLCFCRLRHGVQTHKQAFVYAFALVLPYQEKYSAVPWAHSAPRPSDVCHWCVERCQQFGFGFHAFRLRRDGLLPVLRLQTARLLRRSASRPVPSLPRRLAARTESSPYMLTVILPK